MGNIPLETILKRSLKLKRIVSMAARTEIESYITLDLAKNERNLFHFLPDLVNTWLSLNRI